jgi:lipoprotein-anchoring transpeptidase ErfK/SrfK
MSAESPPREVEPHEPPHHGSEQVRAAIGALFRRKRVRFGAAAAVLLCLAFAGTGWDFRVVPTVSPVPPAQARPASRATVRLVLERQRLERALLGKVPRGTWIVIDQTHNRLRLMHGDDTVLEAPCSAGSGMVLKEGSGGRVWVFDTPRGRFEVLSKSENPVWRKPDWAFVEEGEAIPKDPGDRLEYGSLGEYALYFGNGYMIHGTLYERLLGRPVSHGCIRLGRDPLRQVFRQSPLGTSVYIY